MSKILTIDPGETTGFSTWEDGELVYAGQHELDEFVLAVAWHFSAWPESAPAYRGDQELLGYLSGVNTLVVEDWSLYPWKLQEMAWDKCRTARGIGGLQLVCQTADVPFILQPAKIKDTAVAAGAEEQFLRPLHENRHANDAIMHGVYYHLTKGRE